MTRCIRGERKRLAAMVTFTMPAQVNVSNPVASATAWALNIDGHGRKPQVVAVDGYRNC